MKHGFLYFITVLWTAAALAWRHDPACVWLTGISFVHWLGVFISFGVGWLVKNEVEL